MSFSTPQVAGASRQTVRTIRHWETLGLFGKVARDRRGDRVFTAAQAARAKIISAASMAGMGLEEIAKASENQLFQRIESTAFFLAQVGESMDKDFDL
jgi:DNA-binding transcriptional MerR regulator